jgi:Domain of unknown function (DUF4440)
MLKLFSIGLFALVTGFHTAAQPTPTTKQAPTSAELYRTIQKMDSILFSAYNAQNLAALKNLFTKDLEWYQDNGGLLNYATVIKNFGDIFKRPYRLTRTLVPGSLAVSPIKNYGAIETGSHEFRHIENGKEEVGVFKFLMLWKQEKGQWKISRVVSYDH